MARGSHYADPEGFYSVELPPGWIGERDPEAEGIEFFHPEGPGSLHVLAFDSGTDGAVDPAEELYAFLEEQGVEIEEEDVDDIVLSEHADLAMCEYISEPFDAEEGEDGEPEPSLWIMAVATAPGTLLFASYSCPAEAEEQEREAVHSVLASIRLRNG
jgi:hypothetical protein